VLFIVHISSDKGKEVENVDALSRFPVLQQFQDVFPGEILEFLPHREVDFSIELVPGETATSKTPYRMSTPKLVELKLQLKEMFDKGYVRTSVSPLIFFERFHDDVQGNVANIMELYDNFEFWMRRKEKLNKIESYLTRIIDS